MTERRIAALDAVADFVAIVVFAAIGRRSHGEATAVSGVVEVAWPFLAAAAIGWLVGRVWRASGSIRSGVVVWLSTVALGMVLRHTVADRGTALAFVAVTSAFLGLLIVGRRVVVTAVRRRFARGSRD